jgi:AAA family ATP:ADP antiporter
MVAVSCAMTFLMFCGWYTIRPLRNAIAAEQDLNSELPAVVTATLVTMFVATFLFSTIASRVPRRLVMPATFAFVSTTLVGFFLALRATSGETAVWTARAFYVWASVFNLLCVSSMWSVLADAYRTEQSKRLFGLVSVGATIGAISGAAITTGVKHLGSPEQVILFGAGLFLVVASIGWWLGGRRVRTSEGERGGEGDRLGTNPLAGIGFVVRSRFLSLVAVYMLLYTITSTFLYFEQTRIVAEAFDDRAARTAFNGQIDLFANLAVLAIQLFMTAHVVRFLGIGLTLLATPLVTATVFGALEIQDSTIVLLSAIAARQTFHYALDRPSREMLYTTVPTEAKYKSKNFIDTFVYRFGDALGAWTWPIVSGATTVAMLVCCTIWALVGWRLAASNPLLGRDSATLRR